MDYGQASSHFLARRCIFQLAAESEASKVEMAKILHRDFYVDDTITGTDTIEQAASICAEVSQVLKSQFNNP